MNLYPTLIYSKPFKHPHLPQIKVIKYTYHLQPEAIKLRYMTIYGSFCDILGTIDCQKSSIIGLYNPN